MTKNYNNDLQKTLGPVSNLEKHLPPEWWKGLFNSLYLKTDGDVVENNINTETEVDFLINTLKLKPENKVLDLCCGQGRHALELSKRGFKNITGIDRSRYLIRLARKRATSLGLKTQFSEGDVRKIRLAEASQDVVYLMGNSFGYFEKEEDDIVVLESIKKVLISEGRLALDITNGEWMRNHFEPRSWEWIDQNQFVCRERSLSEDGKKIVSREVIVHAEKGVIADQFYAERLYDATQIQELLTQLNFKEVKVFESPDTKSDRGQDLGMMGNRLFISSFAPKKKTYIHNNNIEAKKVLVLLGDKSLPDPIKKNGKFNEEDLDTINKLKKALGKIKNVSFTYLDNHNLFIKNLQNSNADFVLNFCDEGFKNDAFKELHVPALLEMLEIPYSGSNPATLALCYNKSVVRNIANGLDIPTPEETYYDPYDQAASIPSIFPAILKPNYGDSSIGITKDAVVRNAESLIKYLDSLKEQLPGTPVLIQEFLEGNEYSVAITGNNGNYKSLPILEVDYNNLPATLPKILGYESKWLPESPYWQNISYKEASIDEETRRKLVDYSIKLFERTGCLDYARFDFRADNKGNIKLLEANPNPGWCWDGKLNLMAEFAGYKYEDLLSMIITSAFERYENKVTYKEKIAA